MLKSPYLFAVSVLLALLNWTGLAHAKEIELALSFDLPPAQEAIAYTPSVETPPIESPNLPEPTPVAAEIQLAQLSYPTADLPPIETQTSEIGTSEVNTSEINTPKANTSTDIALSFIEDNISVQSFSEAAPRDGQPEDALESFIEKTAEKTAESSEVSSEAEVASAPVSFESFDGWSLDDWIFEHGSDSLVARTVGSAEGTRQANGRRTPAYFGHVDPGNGVWNLGTFSYQHEATSPEDADHKQLQRLKRQGLQLESQAQNMGITLSLKEKLNGLDLANQAPLAALDKGGYIDRLAQARRLNMAEDEGILWARTYAYIDPDTRRWNAPGLGNNVHSISQDQERRIFAIADAMQAYDPQDVQITALDNLEKITLETTASLDINAIRERSLDNPIEITFELPSVDSSLMQAALTSGEAVEAIDRLIQDVESPQNSNVANDIESTAESAVVASALSGDIGVAFMPTHEITSPDEREHHERDDLFSIAPNSTDLTSADASSADSISASDEMSSASETSSASEESTAEPLQALQSRQPSSMTDSTETEPADKLRSLMDGITTRTLDSEERDRLFENNSKTESEAMPTQNSDDASSDIRLWRVEDSIEGSISSDKSRS